MRPIIVTCGEPAGIGPELAPKLLASGVPFAWLGDPRHLPAGTDWAEVTDLSALPQGPLPVLRHDFAAPATPGQAEPANAAGVIAVIDRAVALTMAGDALQSGAAADRLARFLSFR